MSGRALSPAALDSLSLRELVEGAVTVLDAAGVPSPRVDALALAEHVLGAPRLSWVTLPDSPPDGFVEQYAAAVARRAAREPLQHIVGHTVFRYLTLAVEAGVFVPRPETEVVAQVAIDEANRLLAAASTPVVVDLCCGTGAIALSVDTEAPGSAVHAVDVSPQAIELTRANNRAVGSGNLRIEQADVRAEELLADIAGTVDIVISNPPYVPPDAVPREPEVRDHDPDLALYGGGVDGMDLPRAVIAAAVRLLKPGGLLVVEHAELQGDAAREAALRAGFVSVETRPDLTRRPRMLVARRPADVETGPRGMEDSWS